MLCVFPYKNKAHSGQNRRLSGQEVETIGKYWLRVESFSYEKELRSTLYHDEWNMVMCSRYFKIPKKVKFEGSCHKKNKLVPEMPDVNWFYWLIVPYIQMSLHHFIPYNSLIQTWKNLWIYENSHNETYYFILLIYTNKCWAITGKQSPIG